MMECNRLCTNCRWYLYSHATQGYECRFFDRDRARVEDPDTAKRCPFYENINIAQHLGDICDMILALCEAVERLRLDNDYDVD